jgi:selenocysteine-specific elongation factor
VVITKCDLAEPDYIDLVEAELEEQLAGSRLAGAPVLRVSAVTGSGLDELRSAIDAALASTPPKRDAYRARLPIDRVFTVKGFGTVVTGTLIDGWLEVGQEVEVVPTGKRARIRGLQRHRTKVDTIAPGNRVAVNLAGVHEEDLHRGMTIALPGRV